MTAQTHGALVPAPWEAYVGYSKTLEQMPSEVDVSDAQADQFAILVERMLESQPKNLTELVAKTTALERCYGESGAEAKEAFESIAADIQRLAETG